jgi:ubiquinone/menaquinone biosynthesis C-methylase UbiE
MPPRVLDVGAGTGSYEPQGRWVLAVEPSATMRLGPIGAAPALAARAEALPFDDACVDAAVACVTINHSESPEAGLRELRRVARGPAGVFTFELAALPPWQREYLAEALAIEEHGSPRVVVSTPF